MLTDYLNKTRRLLRNPKANTGQYSDEDLTAYINEARSQLAGEGQCIRNFASLSVSTQVSNFSSITLGPPSTGIRDVFNVRQALIDVGSGMVWLTPRSFEWFTLYRLNIIPIIPAQPNEWSQYGQGVNGTIYVNPTPDATYTFALDTVCRPIDLADDTTPEAIPYPWTDAVPFFAAYLALFSAQRLQQAQLMYQQYQTYTARARAISNPDQLSGNYPQSQDPTITQKLGVRQARGGAGA